MMRFSKLFLAAAACALLFGANSASAGDHLACYKVRDRTGSNIRYIMQLQSTTGQQPVDGCVLKARAKFCCDAVSKTGVVPTAPGGPATVATGRFCCYRIRCLPLNAQNSFPAKDQFGTRTPLFKQPRMLCAPSSPSGAFLDATE